MGSDVKKRLLNYRPLELWAWSTCHIPNSRQGAFDSIVDVLHIGEHKDDAWRISEPQLFPHQIPLWMQHQCYSTLTWRYSDPTVYFIFAYDLLLEKWKEYTVNWIASCGQSVNIPNVSVLTEPNEWEKTRIINHAYCLRSSSFNVNMEKKNLTLHLLAFFTFVTVCLSVNMCVEQIVFLYLFPFTFCLLYNHQLV